ncbi:alpha-L-rhamnosidase [Novosphingobium sp.]|uniref:alpha-L-rhamnosidase n=1 Tax=Novosphingobium sp. TaxID=1874826 RepID=UPI002615A927|nr:alpha-L-rhamnosidase [Novosphingobium sp.]
MNLRTERRIAPLGIDNPSPALSWQLGTDVAQTAYQLRLLSPSAADPGKVAWTGAMVVSSAILDVPYAGPPLASLSRYAWQVRLWHGDQAGPWSDPAPFETAVLDPTFWTAEWIGGDAANQAPLYLRGTADLPDGIVSARACVSALGWYRFFLNGQEVSGGAQVPRWTHFDHVIEYQVYDVTAALRPGRNILAMAVGDGRYRGHSGIADKRETFGDRLAGFLQLVLTFADGTQRSVCTGSDWLAGPGRIIQSDPKRGEQADLRLPDSDWLLDESPPPRFGPVSPVVPPTRRLVAEEVARVVAFQRLPAQRAWQAPSGKVLVDFGQNMAGVVRMRLTQPAGTRLTLTFSEVLGRDGELDTAYLFGDMARHPPQRDVVISGGQDEWWQPWFTIHGFRYVEIDGADAMPSATDLEAIVLSSDLDYHGRFECSDERINQLIRNVRWSMISNFVDTPTDCPTRERSGWTGDIQVFAQTAAYLADVQPYLRRYLGNLALEQHANGAIPPYIPGDRTRHAGAAPRWMRQTVDSTGWGDASVMVPMVLYRHYGDRLVLERQYDSMRRWVDHLAGLAQRSPGRGRLFPRRLGGLERYIVDSGFHWGEWLRPGESMPLTYIRHCLRAPASVATGYFAQSARLLADAAGVLGRERDRARYSDLAASVRRAWRAAFVRRSGARIGDDRQDDYVRALAFDLLPDDERPAALNRLVELIEAADCHLGTGFLSTPLLLPVLARFGRADLAYRLLLQDTDPSWLSQIRRGATTTWESWEGHNRKGDARYSHNHYAFGAVVAWLFEGVAGIQAAEPGFRHIRFAPIIGGGLAHATAEVITPYGRATSAWRVSGDAVELQVLVPSGATGEVVLDTGAVHTVGAGPSTFRWHRSMARRAAGSPRQAAGRN